MSPASLSASPTVLVDDPDLHLLRRATFGPTPESLADIRARGRDAWLAEQLDHNSIDDSACHTFVNATFEYINYSIPDLNGLLTPRDASIQLQQATLTRQVWSKRQLFEVMVEFWSNHFNVFTPHPSTYKTKPVEDRAVIRPHALGRFETMLVAVAKSPGMLAYLMNEDSSLDEPNENYGRELLQLHTVTPSSGYTEAHVRDSAYALTGRSTDGRGTFVYKPEWHYVGQLQVLGWSSANASAQGGMAVGDSYLRYLARHEHTALALSRKLAVRFVSDDPPQSLVDRLADVFLDSGTSIRPWLATLFTSPEFFDAVGQKARRPGEDVAASARALKFRLPTGTLLQNRTAVADLMQDCIAFGHPPLGCDPPTGYPDTLDAWWSVGSTLGRCNAHRGYTRGFPGGVPRPSLLELFNLTASPPATYGALVDRTTDALCAQRFTDSHRNALLSYAGWTAGQTYVKKDAEKMLADLTELVLDSPYRTLR